MENGRFYQQLEKFHRNDGHGIASTREAGDWAIRGNFTAFGVTFGIVADDVAAFHELLERLPPTAEKTSSKAVSRTYVLRTLAPRVDGERLPISLSAGSNLLQSSSDLSDIAEVFEQDVKHWVAAHAPRRVFLRAGVVGWRDRTIVLPGGPRSGVSTLVRALVRCGATCYSDEYAVLEGNTVHPFPSRLPIWTEPGLLSQLWSDERGEIKNPSPLPVGIVVFAPFQSGAVWKPKLISRGKLLLSLFKYAVGSETRADQVLRALEQVTKNSNALEGVRGDAHGVATFLLDRLV